MCKNCNGTTDELFIYCQHCPTSSEEGRQRTEMKVLIIDEEPPKNRSDEVIGAEQQKHQRLQETQL